MQQDHKTPHAPTNAQPLTARTLSVGARYVVLRVKLSGAPGPDGARLVGTIVNGSACILDGVADGNVAAPDGIRTIADCVDLR